MKTTVNDIYSFIDSIAPFEHQSGFDNSGLLVGSGDAECTKVIMTLDITRRVTEEAARKGASLVISHHPVIFNAIKKIDTADEVWQLANSGISAICAHTNLDVADGGVADVLYWLVTDGLTADEKICDHENMAFIRAGKLKEERVFAEYASYVKHVLHSKSVRCINLGHTVKKIAVLGGAGGSELEAVAECGADTFITGDLKYHEFLLAEKLGLNVIEAGHYETEFPAICVLKEKLEKKFNDVEFITSRAGRNIISAL